MLWSVTKAAYSAPSFKAAKNFARADEIRDSLAAQGVVLEDSREGTKWKRG